MVLFQEFHNSYQVRYKHLVERGDQPTQKKRSYERNDANIASAKECLLSALNSCVGSYEVSDNVVINFLDQVQRYLGSDIFEQYLVDVVSANQILVQIKISVNFVYRIGFV